MISYLPSDVYALVIDNYSSTSNIIITADTGSSGSMTPVAGVEGNAIHLDYGLGTGNFVVLGKEYASRDFLVDGGNSIRFRYKATASNTLEIKFTDYDSTSSARSDKLDLKLLTNPNAQWQTVTAAFSTFSVFAEGNSSFDLARVARMTIGMTQESSSRGSGTVWIDQVELFKSTSTLVDDFNDLSSPNFYGGASGTFSGGGGTATELYTIVGTEKVLELSYNVTAAGSFSGLTMALQNRNFQGYTHLSFKVRGNAGGEFLKAGLESPAGQTKVFISTFLAGGITTSFQTVLIPLPSFANVNMSSVTVFSITAENSSGSGAGKIWLDDLAFVRSGESPGVVEVLDAMDTDPQFSNWESYTHDDASLKVTAVADITVPEAKSTNRVYQLDYSFTAAPAKPLETPYAVIERPFDISLAPFSALRFQYKGAAASNTIEFKLIDSDNTVWVKKFLLASNTNGLWKSANFPLSQFTFFSSGDDATLNLKRIRKIEIALVKGSGGSGSFTIDSLEALDSSESQSVSSSRIFYNFRTVNNPFSPNRDGIKDEVFFVYNLAVESKVTLKIYNLDGTELQKVGGDVQPAGEQSLVWNGLDNGNEQARNGLYLFRLEAESPSNGKDEIRQVVGVLK